MSLGVAALSVGSLPVLPQGPAPLLTHAVGKGPSETSQVFLLEGKSGCGL